MKLSHVLIAVTFMGIFAMSTHVSIDSDTWWHLKAGQYMIETRHLITEDPFSYTNYGAEWQYPGLWVQVFMYKLFDWFGPGGLNLWVSLSVALIFLLVWQTTSGNLLLRSAILLLAAVSSSIYWSARPYLLTYFFFALYFYLLERFIKNGNKLWLLPLLMVLWVNSHGGFLAGFLIMVPYLVDRLNLWVIDRFGENASKESRSEHNTQLQHLILVFLLTFAASFISPQGGKLWLLPFSTVSRQAEQLFIAEWQSPDFHNSYLLPFALLIFLVMFVFGRSDRKVPPSTLLALGGFGILGLVSVRNIFFFSILAPAAITRYSSFSDLGKILQLPDLNFERQVHGFGKALNGTLVFLVAIIGFFRAASFVPLNVNMEILSETFPVEAVEFLKRDQTVVSGRMFNAYNFGGYLIWALPEYPVYVDGRADLHQDDIILTWYQIWKGEGNWQKEFDRWDIGFVILEPNAPILEMLQSAGWDEIYRDDVAVIAVVPSENTN